MKEFINDEVANKIINDKQFDDYQILINIYEQNKNDYIDQKQIDYIEQAIKELVSSNEKLINDENVNKKFKPNDKKRKR